jgi:hypothetical protein
VVQPIVLLPNYSFSSFSSTRSPCLHLSLLSSLNLSPHPPSYTLTTCWLTYYTNFTHPQPPEIPDTSTLHHNNRNTSKHTWGPQNPVAPILLLPLTHPTFCLPF